MAIPLTATNAGAGLAALPKVPAKLSGDVQAKAHAIAKDFEAVFLNSMFQQMFTGIDGEGPFGGTPGTAVWRSFLTDEYARSLANRGGIGIADDLYRSLIQHQEARA